MFFRIKDSYLIFTILFRTIGWIDRHGLYGRDSKWRDRFLWDTVMVVAEIQIMNILNRGHHNVSSVYFFLHNRNLWPRPGSLWVSLYVRMNLLVWNIRNFLHPLNILFVKFIDIVWIFTRLIASFKMVFRNNFYFTYRNFIISWARSIVWVIYILRVRYAAILYIWLHIRSFL